MVAHKQTIAGKVHSRTKPAPRVIDDSAAMQPIDSPALLLQNALREADFAAPRTRLHPRLATIALILSLACVYVIAAMMFIGQASA